jgi:hypothetical protein
VAALRMTVLATTPCCACAVHGLAPQRLALSGGAAPAQSCNSACPQTPSAARAAQAALLLTLWDDVKPSAAAARALRPAPPALASVPDPSADIPAQPAAASAGDADDDGVVLTAEAAQAVESILRRQPRSVLKRLPRT